MNSDSKMLHIISNETKSSIDQLSVVTPSVYASIFSKFASSHDTQIENEQKLAQNLLETECSTLVKLQENTSTNANNLSNTTNKAINAIKEKDESKLNEVLRETQALRAEIEKLKESVYKDELTHVYNRKWLHDNYLIHDSEEFKNSGILSIIDLNYFKIVNDTHGHIIGDKVLIFIANQLKKSGHKVIRYGGDEFIIMFEENVAQERASKVLNDIREYVVSKKLKAHETVFRASFSIGFRTYSQGELLSTVIEDADKDMYIDKEAIKKRITGIEI